MPLFSTPEMESDVELLNYILGKVGKTPQSSQFTSETPPASQAQPRTSLYEGRTPPGSIWRRPLSRMSCSAPPGSPPATASTWRTSTSRRWRPASRQVNCWLALTCPITRNQCGLWFVLYDDYVHNPHDIYCMIEWSEYLIWNKYVWFFLSFWGWSLPTGPEASQVMRLLPWPLVSCTDKLKNWQTEDDIACQLNTFEWMIKYFNNINK